MDEHGTVKRYRKHLRDEEVPCDECKAAQAQTVAGQRKKALPRDRKAETRAATIRRRALNRLALENPDRLAVLLAEETKR